MMFEAEYYQSNTIGWTDVPEDGSAPPSWTPVISATSAQEFYEQTGYRDLFVWLAEQAAEWTIEQVFDEFYEIFGGQTDQIVTFEENNNPSISRTESQLSSFFLESTSGSSVIPTGSNDFSSFVYNADGSTEQYFHFDTDGDGGADILYREVDGNWERAESVDATGQPQWVPSKPPHDEGERARQQDE